MLGLQVSLKFRGKVILDSTGLGTGLRDKKNQITEDFITYVQKALQGQRPLIQSYRVYEGISGSTAQANITGTEQAVNEFSLTFTANFQGLNTPIVELYLQAVLTDGTVVTIARVTNNFPQPVHTLTVTWVLSVDFTVYNPPNYSIDITGIYELMFNFFVNPTTLTVSPPNLNVSYSPTSVPEYQGLDGLSFYVAFNNYGSAGLCPVVQYNITYSLLGSQVLDLTGYFNCTPLPNILNYVFFSLNIS